MKNSAHKHTPAPWTVYQRELKYGGGVYIFREGENPKNIHSLAEVFGRTDGFGGTAQADANVMAAAPELLDFVIMIATNLIFPARTTPEQLVALHSEAIRLIEKARGE